MERRRLLALASNATGGGQLYTILSNSGSIIYKTPGIDTAISEFLNNHTSGIEPAIFQHIWVSGNTITTSTCINARPGDNSITFAHIDWFSDDILFAEYAIGNSTINVSYTRYNLSSLLIYS